MALKKNQIVSAQVVLKAASGKTFDGQTAITSQNIAEYMPSPETAQEAMRAFAEAGFRVEAPGGNSFSITAPVSTFEKFFGTKLSDDERGGVKAASKTRAGKRGGAQKTSPAGRELPLGDIPESVGRHVAVVTFGEPPDFGPTNY